MVLRDEIKEYMSRWAAVEAYQAEERRTASLELRWRQLNAAHAMAKSLGLLQPDPSEMGVFERWARIKDQAIRQNGKEGS